MSKLWRLQAACRDLTTSHLPFSRGAGAVKFVRDYCDNCPVCEECLAFGLTVDDPGIYGGMGLRERKALRRKAAVEENPCGTPKGHRRHKSRGEEPCRPCVDARRAADRRAYARRAAT